MKRPKISCIVVSYNKPQFLPAAVDSVLNQTFQDFEIILVDGGSQAQGMKEILEKYSKHPKIRLILTGESELDRKTKAMLSVSANLGLEKARGEYISYLCDDDIYLPRRFEVMMEAFKKIPKAACVYSWQRAYNVDSSGKKSGFHIRKLSGQRGKAAEKYLPLDNYIDINSFMHTRDCLKKLKKPYWPEEKETQGHCDGLFAEKLGEKFIFYPVEEVLDEHRYTNKSLNYQRIGTLRLAARLLVSRSFGKIKKLEIEMEESENQP